MKILTSGDSFTYGEELADRENSAWPFLLGRKLGADVVNLAAPAASNDAIVRVTVEHLTINPNTIDLVAIAWTSPGRTEHADDAGVYDVWPGYQGGLFTKDGNFWRKELCDYISKYHNSSWYYIRYIQHVLLMQSFLEHRGIPYVMLTTGENEHYKKQTHELKRHYDDSVDKSCFLGFGREGMSEWTYGCPKGPRGHFLEQGHQIVADKVYGHIRN